ncbi:adenylate kinase-domain-containing protein [Halteromyces radiatus]|uniref:adenylate kinase-domain-containing protein n=1 Tax=Halteromyces radiatus TaxID=101107 RepID=UPI0022202E45|nr:adenylate kinase-domain-containing protein [Halteromyces radiatus]KAI8085186.1 adenylate kinase-domain-containing protein [Halteromyces radiatus]
MQPLRLLLLGSPGSGKGTQSERLKTNFGVHHLSSGDLLRKNINQQSFIGQQAADYVAQGQLVPDNLLVSLVDRELGKIGGHNWLLDGFPRTLKQAHELDNTLNKLMQPLNLVINLEVPEEVILDRIMDRWVHIPSGRVYNLSYNPPRVQGLDDVTGEPLAKRPDDCPDVFRVRMQQHKIMADPLLNHYHSIAVTVRGNTSDEIYPQIEREIVNRLGLLPGSTTTTSSSTCMPGASMKAANVVAKYHQRRRQQYSAQNSTGQERVVGVAQ